MPRAAHHVVHSCDVHILPFFVIVLCTIIPKKREREAIFERKILNGGKVHGRPGGTLYVSQKRQAEDSSCENTVRFVVGSSLVGFVISSGE